MSDLYGTGADQTTAIELIRRGRVPALGHYSKFDGRKPLWEPLYSQQLVQSAMLGDLPLRLPFTADFLVHAYRAISGNRALPLHLPFRLAFARQEKNLDGTKVLVPVS